jgi:K+:H+ antiporter
MHSVEFLQDLAVVMIIAGLVTILFHRLKQPVVLGYILAGVIIGPFTPPFELIKNQQSIQTLADLGMIFLMFSLGLEFSLRRLRDVGATAMIAAMLEIVLMIWAGYAIGRAFGWRVMDSIFLGAILSISSTTIIIKVLNELKMTKERFAHLIFGILIVEDLLAIVIIAMLSGIAVTGELNPSDAVATVTKLIIFLVALLVLGLLIVPRLLAYVGRFKSNEMLLITVLAICFGVSLVAVRLEYSVALGAFIAGAIVAEAREVGKIELLTEPLRDMFSAVFFVAIGMLINPELLIEYAWPIAVITVVVVVGQVVTCTLGTLIAGHDLRTSLRVGMGLAQIGEFSFIIAALGQSLNVTSKFLYPIAVSVSAITTLLSPMLIRNSDRFAALFERIAPKPVVNMIELYSGWLERMRKQRENSAVRQQFRRMAWQIALNVTLVAGIFIAAAFGVRFAPHWLVKISAGMGGINALAWFAAILLTLPLYVAIFRKLQALGMMISEVSVTSTGGSDPTLVRAVVANSVLLGGLLLLSILSVALSSAILPPLNVVILLLLVVAVITVLLWRHFVRIYAKAQFSLRETLTATRPHQEAAEKLPGVLRNARLETLAVTKDSPAAGKLIRELALRSQTGASIVAIDRSGQNIINPGPDDEIQPGDHVILLGELAQLDSARQLFVSKA